MELRITRQPKQLFSMKACIFLTAQTIIKVVIQNTVDIC